MGRHHEEAMLSPENRNALATLVERERVLTALLTTWFKEDQAMLEALNEALTSR
jgi:hypothetical protein